MTEILVLHHLAQLRYQELLDEAERERWLRAARPKRQGSFESLYALARKLEPKRVKRAYKTRWQAPPPNKRKARRY